MNKTIAINYWWKCGEFPNGIPDQLKGRLNEHAKERIAEMMAQGYVAGELCECVRIDVPGKETPPDGYECRGWFTIIETDIRSKCVKPRIRMRRG